MYYFLSVLLFPDNIGEYDGYQDYFLSRRAWFFGFAAMTMALDIVDTLIKRSEHWRSLGLEYPGRIIAFLMLCAVAARTRNLAFHTIFILIALLYELSFFSRHFFILW